MCYIRYLSCNVIFMIFTAFSRRFVRVFCLVNARRKTGFHVLTSSGLASHGCIHWNFQHFPRVSNDFFELFVFWIDGIDSFQHSCIVELRFFDSPLLFFFSLSCIWHIFRISGHKWSGLDVACFFSAAPRTTYIRLFFIQYGERGEIPSTHLMDLGPLRFSNNRQCGCPAPHLRSYL